MSKTALIILAVLGVFALGIGTCVVGFLSLFDAPIEATDAFLTRVAAGDPAGAYATTAASFRAAQTPEAFAAQAQRLALGHYASASWSSRNISNGVATLEGTIRTRDGGRIPLTVELVEEGGAWRVRRIASPGGPGGVQATPASGADAGSDVPPRAQLASLVETTLLQLHGAIHSGDFGPLYAQIHPLWQQQTTPEALRQAFASLLADPPDVTRFRGIAPRFSPEPSIQNGDELHAGGHIVDGPVQVRFFLRYLQHEGIWKPIQIAAYFEPAGTPMPADPAGPANGAAPAPK